ncbi:hypothetical protein INT43_001408 [Umbelopsis isabellina]|uniref:P-loop containing nucleoside triphosphate hydrolase protein n=1 Tax=Mortierella isabellina TaxID=91625 RepID=A0A8H7PDK2_MORIS|nr:hypothetical protein INT43_001408 [Umbelopsis isabellina]
MAPLEIIGTGWSRTGTAGMREALLALGYKVSHMLDIVSDPTIDTSVYEEAWNGKDVDWNRAFANYNASLDWPNATFYKQLMEKYPDAKVLHTTRDPEKWYESVVQTVYATTRKYSVEKDSCPPGVLEGVTAADEVVFNGYFKGEFLNKEKTIQMFKDHDEEVKRIVPAEKLLVFETGVDGWDKLCSFLGKGKPDTPWPHINSREDFQVMVKDLEDKKELKNLTMPHDIYAE